MLNFYTFSKFFQFARTVLDITILSIILYYAIKIVRNNSKTVQIFKGILFVIFLNGIATMLGLKSVSTITEIFVTWGFLAIIIIFQPEIRGMLEKLGKTSVFTKISTLTGNERGKLVNEIVKAVQELSEKKTGALITLEQSQSLADYIKTGTTMNSVVTAELLTSIFVTSTPLHDGAVIIQGDKIACASAYFPPTELDIPSRYGARHRAAIGISEITDSLTIVVSEETGLISVAENGKLVTLTADKLYDYLLKSILEDEIEISNKLPVEVAKKKVDKFEKAYEVDEQTPKPESVKFLDLFKKKNKSDSDKEKPKRKRTVKKQSDKKTSDKFEAKAVFIPQEDVTIQEDDSDAKQ